MGPFSVVLSKERLGTQNHSVGRGFSQRWAVLARLVILGACWLGVWGSAAEAASLKGVIKSLSESLSKQSDEAAQRLGKLLDELARHSDEALGRVGKQLHPPSATDELIAQLAKVGIHMTDELQAGLRGLDDVSRGALVGLLEQSDQLLKRWAQVGRSLDEILPAIQKGGPDVLYACRQMQTDEALQTVVRGAQEFGADFVEFARKGDERAVLRVSEYWDDLKRGWDDAKLKPEVEDLFKNPVKYFDELGRPTKQFDDLIARLRSVAFQAPPVGFWRKVGQGLTNSGRRALGFVVGLGAWIWGMTKAVGGGLAALLAPLLPLAGQAIVALAVQLFLLLALGIVLVLLLIPLVIQWVNRLLWKVLRWLARGQGKTAQWAQKKLRQPPREVTAKSYLPRWGKMPLQVLRLGLLGVQRAGKTTFTVMLAKHLHRAIPGASLRPHLDDPDAKLLRQMEEEVARCRPTQQERQVALKLTWPFFWQDADAPQEAARSSNQSGSDSLPPALDRDGPNQPAASEPGSAQSELAGKMEMCLELVDYPGEWANAPETRQVLSQKLKKVDGLFVVIDPTDLEDGEASERLRRQQENLERMFASDRLDLGGSFLRSLAILMTKRDAWTPELLERLAKTQGRPLDAQFHQMVQLAQKPVLSLWESQQLGQWLFELLFPGVYRSLQTRLEESFRPRRWWCQRLIPWFSLDSRPQLRIFAVSQLGMELGRQVVEYRRQVQQWQTSLRPQPPSEAKEGPMLVEGQKDSQTLQPQQPPPAGTKEEQVCVAGMPQRQTSLPPQPPPEIQLDLDRADPQQLDILHAFRWMLNSIPGGWMWTAQRLPKGFWWYWPIVWKQLSPAGRMVNQIRKRFPGAPCVQRNTKVLRRRARWAFGLAAGVLFALGVLLGASWRNWEIEQFRQMALRAQGVVAAGQEDSQLYQELEDWKSALQGASDYIPQAEYVRQVLGIWERMRPYRKPLDAQETSFQARLKAAAGWFEEYRKLPSPPETYLDEVKQLWVEVKKALPPICQDLIAQLRQESDALASQNQYEAVYRLVVQTQSTLEILPYGETEPYRHELGHIERLVARRDAEWRWNGAMQKVQDFLRQERWPEVVKALQNVAWPGQLAPEEKTAFERRKADHLEELAQRWFSHLQQQIETLLTGGKPDEVYTLIHQFRNTVGWGKWPETLRNLQGKIADRFVQISIQEAATQRAQAEFQNAEAFLERCRPYLPACSAERVKDWHRNYGELLRAQKKWQAFIEHLLANTPAQRPEDWDKQLERAWHDWADDFYNRLQSPQTDLEVLSRELTWAQSRRTDMPPSLAEKLADGEKLLLQRQVEQALTEVESLWKEKQYAKAHEKLNRFERDLSRLPPTLVGRWVEGKLRLFEAEQRYLFAVQWMGLLSPDIQKTLQGLPGWNWPERRRKLIDRAAESAQQKFRDLLADDPQAAFGFLHQEAHSPNTPAEYREALSIFADREISSYIYSSEKKMEESLQKKAYQQANKHLEELRNVLAAWLAESKYKDQIDRMAEKIENAAVEDNLTHLENDLKQGHPNFQEIHTRLQQLLRQPELKDHHKKKAATLMQTLLTQWEKTDYETLRRLHANYELQELEAVLKRYTDKTIPYWNQIPMARWNAVKQLQNWFQQFQNLQTYEITHVEGAGIPRNLLWPPWDLDFDFAFRIQVGRQEYIPPGTYQIEGEETVPLEESLKVQWAPGIPVTIDIWDEQVGLKGYYVGRISITDRYSFIKLCIQLQKIDASKTDWQNHNWSEAKLRLICPQIQPPPDLPP